MSYYFAHPISDYGTGFEEKLVEALQRFGLTIENPNQPHHQEGYAKDGMDYFLDRVLPACDGCVFLPFPGGLIGSGVAMEVEHFLLRGQRVLEVGRDPGFGTFLLSCTDLPESRILSRQETRGVTRMLRTLPNGGRQ
jgi:hypothetical protein